jgi:hypothetical protein
MKEEYYTAKEAMELLGKPSTSFYREVREGRIPHKGKRPNMRFPKKAIDAIAEVGGDKKEEEENLIFTPSTIADAWTKQEITHQPYENDDAVPFKTVLEWRKMNDDISMNVKLRNRILGWTTFLPLEETIITELLYDRMREKDIPPRAIKKWTDKQLSVYIPIIEVIPSDSTERDRKVGAFLLRKTIKWATTLMIQYDIKNWYGIGTTAEGQDILERLGFELITDLEEGKRKGYAFESKAEPVRLISRFLQSLE